MSPDELSLIGLILMILGITIAAISNPGSSSPTQTGRRRFRTAGLIIAGVGWSFVVVAPTL